MIRLRIFLLAFLANIPALSAANKIAPDFTATDSAGVEHNLSAHTGKIVILEWMNPYCEQNGKYYNSKKLPMLQAKWNDDTVIWLMVNSYAEGQPGYVSGNVARFLLTSTGSKVDGFISDKSGTLAKQFGIDRVPSVAVISGDKQLVYKGSFDDHQGEEVAGLLEAPSHIDAVLTALKEKRQPNISSNPNGCVFERE